MTKRQSEIKEMYEKGVPVKDIAQILEVGPSTIYTVLTRLRRDGLLSEYRTNAQNKIIGRSCTLTPGKACLSCPYDRCVASGKATTKEEKEMLEIGLPSKRRTKSEIEVDEYYG